MAIPNDRTAEKRVKKLIKAYQRLARLADVALDEWDDFAENHQRTIAHVQKAMENLDGALFDISDILGEAK